MSYPFASTSTHATSKLFAPLKIGAHTLEHRVVMAPLTRFRSDKDHVHRDIALEYYTQRSIVPGTLLVAEATVIAHQAGGFPHVPGIWNKDQITSWRRVTDAVHKNKSFISLQLGALGRGAYKSILDADDLPFVSASNIPIKAMAEQGSPRPLTIEEINQYFGFYAQAAKNAIEAGFDYVEIHGANGYLVDQFLQDVSNNRTDKYGGSIENRSRFALGVVKAVADTVGQARTAIRFGPYVTFQDMKMKDPIPQFSHVIQALANNYPNLAYLHLIRSENPVAESLDFARKIWQPRPLVVAGRYEPDQAIKDADEIDVAVAFGRWFIANPDLPNRLRQNQPLTMFNAATFYLQGEDKPEGYIDYPLSAPVANGLAEAKDTRKGLTTI